MPGDSPKSIGDQKDIPKLQHSVSKSALQIHSQQRSRSNSETNNANSLNNTQSSTLPSTSLRAKLSRNSSSNSIIDSNKTKMKLKLQLSQPQPQPQLLNLQTTPVLLSPRGTPNTSPDNRSDGFFPNFESMHSANANAIAHQSHLDTLLDESGISTPISNSPNTINNSTMNEDHIINIPIIDQIITNVPENLSETNNVNNNNDNNHEVDNNHEIIQNIRKADESSTMKIISPPNESIKPPLRSRSSSKSNTSSIISNSKTNLHSLQTKLQRLSSSNSNSTPISNTHNSPRSPLNKYKSRNIAYQALPEPVRPQTSILKSNFNTKFSQQYQQQEKMYLTGINKYRNKYKNADDYYNNKFNNSDDIESNNESSIVTSSESIPDIAKLGSIDSEIFNSDDDETDYISKRTDRESEYEALKALNQQIGSEFLSKELESMPEYSLDSNLLLELLNRNDEIKFENSKDNSMISERLEWQAMLQTVLTGDVITGEKTKLVKPLTELEGENLLRVGYKEDFWLGIRAKLFGRTEEEQKRLVLYHRGLVDETFDEIMNFKLEFPINQLDMSYNDKVKFASEKVNDLLDKYERCQELWRTQKEMETDKPQCATPEFINRINCLVAWTSVTDAVERESDVLKQWVGNENLDILKPGTISSSNLDNSSRSNSNTITHVDSNSSLNEKKGNHFFKDDRPFVERILKEKDIENLFNKRLFTTFSHWTIKAKNSYLEYHQYFNELKLPSYLDNLFVLTNFPSKLMKEIIKTRLAYADKLKNPTMMMIDQILDDLKTYIRLALEIRISMLEYCAPVEGWVSFPDYQDPEFDNTIKQCVNYYMSLLNRKLLFSQKGFKSFRTFKEPEELEKEWTFLQNMGFYIDDFSVEFSSQICSLFIKLINRLYIFIQNQIQGPPSDGYRLDSQRLIRWYSSSIENFGQLRRKFLRFELHLCQYFQNSISFKVLPRKTQKFFTLLKESNHALYHNAKIAEEGVYIFVSESLVNRPHDVESILKSSYLGVDFSKIPKRHLEVIKSYYPSINYYDSNNLSYDHENDETNGHLNLDYVLIVVPPKALMWDGIVIPFNNIDKITIDQLSRGSAMLLTRGGPDTNVTEIFEMFQQFTHDTIKSNKNVCCSVPKIEEYFQVSLKLFLRISCVIIDCTPAIRNQCRGVGNCQELVNNIFIFARDIGRDSIRNNTLGLILRSGRGTIILRLIKLSIEWLSFIVDDCSPTDPKTFRWCVSALEFAMDVTRGFNILTLDSQKFYRLKDKVAGCMSLLIAHFDIMGARAKELQKTRMQNYALKSQKDIYTLDDESLGSLRQHIMYQIKEIEDERRNLQVEQSSVGRVLDDTDMENQLLTYLASSFSSVSIRWQKGKFLGGGTFGSVFACVNLDTGGPMAVKEIRFQDRQSIKTVVPAIKGEMSVLELLSHPNIVQFFGVEVHRDRVYIFMEYCSGGSLAGLLEYGRIEDEIVIQLYTLQMLEALAYLHQFGIVHRDVKPDNILLDHLGVIKFVDFGSAKVIAIPNGNNTATTSTGGSTSSTVTNSNNETPPQTMTTNEINKNNVVNNNANTNTIASTNSTTTTTPDNTNNTNNNTSTTSLDVPISDEMHGSTTSTMSSARSYSELGTGGTIDSYGQNLGKYSNSTTNTMNAQNLHNTLSSLSISMSSISAYTGTNDKKNKTKEFESHAGAIVESIMDNKKTQALTGTPMYMSPETIKGEKMGRFGAMDIWSLGCCILEMATGRRPWSNLDNEFAVMYHIAAGHLPQFPNDNELSEQGLEFLTKCLQIDPTKRASAVELLQDPWIQAIRNEAFSDSNALSLSESLVMD
jgi:mitogen-activated protein kinase kinase kinase